MGPSISSFPWSAFLTPCLCILLGVAFYRGDVDFENRLIFRWSQHLFIFARS
jgi:hypothetical protein